MAEKLASTDTVRAAYLADQGKSLEPVKMDKVWDKFGNDTLQKVVDRLGVNTLAEIEANLETGESVKDALGENAEVIRDILRDYYREQGEPMLRRMAVKRHWTDAEINERRQNRIDNSMDGVSIFTLEDIVHHAWDMYQDGGATKGEIDRMATSDALRSSVDDHAVEEWIAGKLDGLLGEAGINIAGMQVSRDEAGGQALIALTVDSAIPADVLAAMAEEIGAVSARSVDLEL